MISLRNVDLRYGHRSRAPVTLHNITLDIAQGSFCWLLGPSGAGKSSLLRLLQLGVLPSAGRMELMDTDISTARRSTLARLRQKIGMIHQDFRLLADLPAYDNVALPLRLKMLPESEIESEVGAMLSWLGLDNKFAVRPAELSGGEQQRVAIARAMIHRPAILLADEPMSALDDLQARRLMDLLLDLNDLGSTVIVATHNDSFIRQFPAPRLYMKHGCLSHEGF